MKRRLNKAIRKKSFPWLTSAAIHLAAIGLLVLGDQPKERGAVTILNIELAGHGGDGAHTEIKHRSKLKRSAKALIQPTATTDPDAVAAETAPTDTDTAAGNPNPAAEAAYVNEIVRLINQAKRYPKMALIREEEGQVMISVDVASDGTVSNPKIEKPSPYDSLNQGALDTLKQMGKLPPAPASLKNGIHLHIPILYQISR
ncbi:MAG: energy transducer TonB [Bdellovibrionales bacterium]|nr:energy transducer TonB [Bdellovibrionales bacterium]